MNKHSLFAAPYILSSLDLDYIVDMPERIWKKIAVYDGNDELHMGTLLSMAATFARLVIRGKTITWNIIVGVSHSIK